MRSLRSSFGVTVLSLLAIAAGFFGARPLLEHVEFARAENNVEATRQQLETVQDLSTVFRHVGEVVEPSVVNIKVQKAAPKQQANGNGENPDDLLRRFFREHGQQLPPGWNVNPPGGDNNNDETPQPGETVEGSGVIMEVADGNGYILTNNHVAADAAELLITLDDGRQIKNGKVLGTDPKSDLAVIQIKADRLVPATWGNSDELAKGDWVLAFGSPFDYVGSMTHGIVSALNRDEMQMENGLAYENFIQVDAPINPGNSGGPLCNIHGEVVGINTAIATMSGGFQGIGFAIPANQAKGVYTALKDHGAVVRGYLGVQIQSVSEERPGLIKSFGYTDTTGVFVENVVSPGPSDGKLNNGDIITSLNGEKVTARAEFRNRVAAMAPGSKAEMKVWRDGKEQDVEIVIGKQPENLAAAVNGNGGENGGAIPPPEAGPIKSMGMTFKTLDAAIAQRMNLRGVNSGALVDSVDQDSVAAKNGVQAGDVITMVGKTYVHTAQEATDALSKADLKQGVRLYVITQEGRAYVFLQNDDNQ